jgi:hypothetical protein
LVSEIERRLLELRKAAKTLREEDEAQEIEILKPQMGLFPAKEKRETRIAEKEGEIFDRLFLPSLLSAAWLPRQGSKVEKHERAYGNLSIIVSTGYRRGLDPVYVPTGLIPRRILSALTTKAILTRSRFVDVSSISALLSEMNLSINGNQIKRVQKQMIQLARARVEILFSYRDHQGKNREVFYDGAIFRRLSAEIEETGQGRLIPNIIEFDPHFYSKVLDGHAVPYSKELYQCNSSLTHDVFLWLERRIYDLKKSDHVSISYENLWVQFGSGKEMNGMFRKRIKESISEVSKLLNLNISVRRKDVLLRAGTNKALD